MANLFLNLPAPAGDGSGAAVDVSLLSAEKTVVVQGSYTGVVIVEFSNESNVGPWAQAAVFPSADEKSLAIAARFMRISRAGVTGGAAPTVDVGAVSEVNRFVDLPAPAGDGVGASVDVSALGDFNTIVCAGAFTGAVTIEISQDNVNWAQIMSFGQPGWQSKMFSAQYMRMRRSGVVGIAGTPNVDVGATDDVTFVTRTKHETTLTPAGYARVPAVEPTPQESNAMVTMAFTLNTDRAFRTFKIPSYFVSDPSFHIHWTKSSDVDESGKAARWRISYRVINGFSEDGGGAETVVETEDTYDDNGTTTRIVYRSPNLALVGFVPNYYVTLKIEAITPVGAPMASEPALFSMDLMYIERINYT